MTGPWCGRVRSIFGCAFLFAFILAVGFGGTIAPAWAQGSREYQLGPGDLLRVVVFGHEDLSGEFEVKGSGYVSLPLIREVNAASLTLRQFEQAVIDANRNAQNIVTVRVELQM